jgi:hypothetical protein
MKMFPHKWNTPLLDLRYRIVNEDFHSWEGRDVFQMFSFNRYSFFETTGETPETLLEIVRQLNNDMFQVTGRPSHLRQKVRKEGHKTGTNASIA